MQSKQLVDKIPQEIQELVSKGIYNLFWSASVNEFAVLTNTDKIFRLDRNGKFLSESDTKKIDLDTYRQLYTHNLDSVIQYRNSRT